MSNEDIGTEICSMYDLPVSGEWLNLSYLEDRGITVSTPVLDNHSPSTSSDIARPDSIDLCVFHAPCSDGTAAAYAIGRAYPSCDFFGVNRGSGETDLWLPDTELENKTVVLVDYVYARPLMEQLVEAAGHVMVIDHHVSEQELLEELSVKYPKKFSYVFSHTVCAAVLAWQFFHPTDPVPVLYQYINDNDVGAWALSNIGRFAAGFSVASPVIGPGWSSFEDFGFFTECVQAGKAFVMSRIVLGMLSKHVERRDVYSDAQRSADRRLRVAPQYVCRVVNVSYCSSSGALHRALLEGEYAEKKADISMLYYFVDCIGSWKCSLRSSNESEVNVGQIASLLGGGGHACAGSFSYRGDFNDLFINEGNDCQDDWDDYWGYYG